MNLEFYLLLQLTWSRNFYIPAPAPAKGSGSTTLIFSRIRIQAKITMRIRIQIQIHELPSTTATKIPVKAIFQIFILK
jgi:hypothetical protein